MKKTLKILTLPILAAVLVACGNNGGETNQETTEEVSTEASSVVESEVASESVASETSEASEASEESAEEEANNEEVEEPNEDAIAINFYVSGEEESIASFNVPDAEGLSVLEAMESIEDLDFTFNETEGVIDVIEGYENDYDFGTTWTYLLNDEFAQLGVVSQTLTAGDKVDWYYGTIDDIPVTIIYE